MHWTLKRNLISLEYLKPWERPAGGFMRLTVGTTLLHLLGFKLSIRQDYTLVTLIGTLCSEELPF